MTCVLGQFRLWPLFLAGLFGLDTSLISGSFLLFAPIAVAWNLRTLRGGDRWVARITPERLELVTSTMNCTYPWRDIIDIRPSAPQSTSRMMLASLSGDRVVR